MASEPMTLFARIADPAGVARLLRQRVPAAAKGMKGKPRCAGRRRILRPQPPQPASLNIGRHGGGLNLRRLAITLADEDRCCYSGVQRLGIHTQEHLMLYQSLRGRMLALLIVAVAALPGRAGACLQEKSTTAAPVQETLDQKIARLRKAVALALPADHAKAHHSLGDALLKKGVLDEAETNFRKAIRLEPQFASAHDSLGVTLLRQGRGAEAVACHVRAIELDPRSSLAHMNLGAALLACGKRLEARDSCRKAIELDPRNPRAYVYLGQTLHGDNAIASFRKAIEIDPRFAEAYHKLGLELRNLGKLDEAIACYRKSIELSPATAAPHRSLGDAMKAIGRIAEAEQAYRRAQELERSPARN